MSENKPQKIIVQLPGTPRDMVESLPMIDALKGYFPHIELSVLVRQNMEGFLRGKNIDHCIVFKKWPRFAPLLNNGEDVITFIQKNEYDVGITIPESFSSAYLFFQGMVKQRIGFNRLGGSFLLTDAVPKGPYRDLLKPLGIHRPPWKPSLQSRSKKLPYLHIGIKCAFDHFNKAKKWLKEMTPFLLGEIPDLNISILGKKENFKEMDEVIGDKTQSIKKIFLESDYAEIIDLVYTLDVLVTDDPHLLAIAKGVETSVVDITGLVGNPQLFPEDFFFRIKDALLHPLKQRVIPPYFSELIPITSGFSPHNKSIVIKKRVGVIILAGGVGRRLGLDKPKGFLELGSKNLFDILLEKTIGAEKIGILTSPMTYKETATYCEGKNIDLFNKKVYPTEGGDGVSPEGNGALFDAVVHSPYWEQWKDLDIISVIPIDNPLADPLDVELISTEKQLAVVGVCRDKKEERMGVLCLDKGALVVREYFTLGTSGMEGLGYSGIFAATPSFFKSVALETLPFYRIKKQNQIFYERLLIDGFKYAKDFEVIEKERKKCFFPIKEKRDLFTYCNQMSSGGKEG